ncbi:STAS domain-containing protein [Acinetobacter sp. ME22]|uniref:STAS domain-containing protein n=1 Tax=Acinetobacter TaxID=469 RepID=UPI001250449C|nr:STAS domain-containing protein [Acinetobacter brisouii]MCG2573267.1 STAS domain-containing protein [Acinetobacter sp. ME22]
MIELKDQQLCLSGTINFQNAEQVYQQGLALIRQQPLPLVVNLAELQHGNTLALAVLVQWLRQTPEQKGLHFQAVPAKMLKIIEACHLQDDLIFLS